MAALMLLGCLSACADRSPAEPAGSPHTASTTTSADTGIARLRLGDDGSRLTLDVAETAVIMLPGDLFDWTEPEVGGTAVTLSEDVSDAATQTRSWTVTAHTAGVATISTTGSPTCRSATPPCAAPDLAWEVRVTVR